jgi:hypothetical protein
MQEIGERGTITRIHRGQQGGTIRGEDGRERHFDREGMIYWLRFDELKPGDPVRYDVERAGSAINVERIDFGRRRASDALGSRPTTSAMLVFSRLVMVMTSAGSTCTMFSEVRSRLRPVPRRQPCTHPARRAVRARSLWCHLRVIRLRP